MSRLEGSDVIRNDFLEPAVKISKMSDEGDVQPLRQLADFLDTLLSEEGERQKSIEHIHRTGLADRSRKQLATVQGKLRELELKRSTQANPDEIRNMKQEMLRLERQCKEDQQRERDEQNRVHSLAMSCIKALSGCLAMQSTGSLTKVACRFLSLWFEYGQNPDEKSKAITQQVKESMQKSSLGPLSPFIYQLAARLGKQESLFQKVLSEILFGIGHRNPQTLWPLLSLRNGNEVPTDMRGADRHVADKVKIEAAAQVLERLRKDAQIKPALVAMETLSKFYMSVAFMKIDKNKRDALINLNTIQGYKHAAETCRSIPVPTTPPAEGIAVPKVSKFIETMSIAKQGLSAPRILTLIDSTGIEHKQIVKGHDDLRQDAVMQQLFRLLNDVFAESPRAREADLRLRTFQVVPLSPCAGVMEFVQQSATLSEILTPDDGAHRRYRPQDWTHNECRGHMKQALDLVNTLAPAEQAGIMEKAFGECYGKFKPVMHLTLLERFPSPRDWHRARQLYARSASVSSIVGYIVGLGDRHPNNILLDQTTGELVHIDFGITFDAGKALRVPERVPFRLTRDMVDGLGCLGTCGLFRRGCETTMEVLRDSAALVTAIVEVFVYDPIYTWSVNKKDSQGSAEQGADGAWAA